MSQKPLSKEWLLQTCQHRISNGRTLDLSDSQVLNCITTLGGIDEVLHGYLSNNTVVLNKSQLQDIHELLNKLSTIHHVANDSNLEGKGNKSSITKQIVHKLNESDTFAVHFFGPKHGVKLQNTLYYKPIIILLILSMLTYAFVIAFYGKNEIYSMISLPILCILWIPYNIIWLLSANRIAFKLVATTFEYWFKVCYMVIFVTVTYQSVTSTFVDGADNNDDNQLNAPFPISIFILYAICSMIAVINIGALDAFNMRNSIKFAICAGSGLLLTTLTLTCQFGATCADEDDMIYDIFGTNNVSAKNLQVSSTRILAIFMWKQAILTILRKNKCSLIKHSATIQWVNDIKSESDEHKHSKLVETEKEKSNANKLTQLTSYSRNTTTFGDISHDLDHEINTTTYVKPGGMESVYGSHNGQVSDLVVSTVEITLKNSHDLFGMDDTGTPTTDNDASSGPDLDALQDGPTPLPPIDTNCMDENEEKTPFVHIVNPSPRDPVVLARKCKDLNTTNEQFVYDIPCQSEFEFEHIFKGIGVETFWDKFWSNKAIFSPIDWIEENPLSSSLNSTKWKCKSDDNQWFSRNIECVFKLEDIPSFVPSSVSEASNFFIFKYFRVKPNYYVIHKILWTEDVPFADIWKCHQKIELKQNATVSNIGNEIEEINTDTVMCISIGIEWLKSSWFKSQIKSQTLKNVKDDCIKYCKCIDGKIKNMTFPKYRISNEGSKEAFDENELHDIIDEMNDYIDCDLLDDDDSKSHVLPQQETV